MAAKEKPKALADKALKDLFTPTKRKRGRPKKIQAAKEAIDLFVKKDIVKPNPKEIKSISRPASRSDELCNIIKVASRYQVSKLKLNDCSIEFFRSSSDNALELKESTDSPEVILDEIHAYNSGLKPTSPKIELALDKMMDDFHDQNLMIEDPLAYEQKRIDELTEGRSSLDEDS